MKTSNAIRHPRSAGLTLLEVIVIVAISVILLGFLLPVFSRPCPNGRLADSLSNAKQITLALRMYAEDHGGRFPSTGIDNTTALVPSDPSNRALENIFVKTPNVKKIFLNKVSAWCKNPATDTAATDSTKLKQGQNDWNYVVGLSENSDSRWPLIATATASATDLTYSNVTTDKGGVWGGTDAIVGYVDGSARMHGGGDMNLTNRTKTFPKRPDNGANILIPTSDWLGTGSFVLAPE